MKFENIYTESESVIREQLLNFWVRGNHPMRQSFENMLKREPLMAEPVFQSMFDWMQTDDKNWQNIIDERVWKGLDFDFHPPYEHQVRSWKVLKGCVGNKKSIVVTAGTGSGKTECFMGPVLDDILNHKEDGAVNAMFLYPLNALMDDQRERLRNVCNNLDLRFAVYNGSTKNYKVDPNGCEIRDRIRIRDKRTTPQILLTNPSILEYILVRDEDQEWINRSRGKLRWIVIDEAHTFSGSRSIELANQIQRILSAFGMKPNDVHFVCTSATIGTGNGPATKKTLLDFISSLTGQPVSLIEYVDGSRVIPELDDNTISASLKANKLDGSPQSVKSIRNLISSINDVPGLSIRDIWRIINVKDAFNIQKALNLVDKLCEIECQDIHGEKVNLLKIRGHFFVRTINDIKVCPNPNCTCHNDSPLGYITSQDISECPHCHTPLLSLVQCKDCGNIMISCEVNGVDKVRNIDKQEADDDLFMIEDEADNDDFWVSKGAGDDIWTRSVIAKNDRILTSEKNTQYFNFDVDKDGRTILSVMRKDSLPKPEFVQRTNDDFKILCPYCNSGMGEKNTQSFRAPVHLLNNILAPRLLSETLINNNRQWGQYITFTDSRQGTAIRTKIFNSERERIYAQGKLISYLRKFDYTNNDEYKNAIREMNRIERDANDYGVTIQTLPSRLKQEYDGYSDIVKRIMQMGNIPQKLTAGLADAMCSEPMFKHLEDDPQKINAYKHAIIRNVLGRRPINELSIEGMGFIKLVYPQLQNAKLPQLLKDFNESHCNEKDFVDFSDDDWRNFLKIAIDYVIRMGNHLPAYHKDEKYFVRSSNTPSPIFNLEEIDRLEGKKYWPSIIKNNNGQISLREQNRLILLLCAALGITTIQELNDIRNERLVNNLLHEAWRNLVDLGLLKKVQSGQYPAKDDAEAKYNLNGYYLNLGLDSNDVEICLQDKSLLCPVSRRFIDVTFRGFSPSMSGELSEDNFNRFKVDMEWYDIPIQIGDNAYYALKESGLLSPAYDDIIKCDEIIIAAEHSAQVSDDKRREYTEQFKDENDYSLNILNCSTTMEMGVDIGKISLVLMNTVPPLPANYLQRAGRAGRKGQSKAAAFTICSNTTQGIVAFQNPMWALMSNIYISSARTSEIIVQRHINSFFLHHFVTTEKVHIGRVGDFFGTDENENSPCNSFINSLLCYDTDIALESSFCNVFPRHKYGTKLTIDALRRIKEEYFRIINILRDAHRDFSGGNNPIAAKAVMYQLRRIKYDVLLDYLSKAQFLPNASMPTDVVEFDYSTKDQTEDKQALLSQIEKIKASRDKETEPDKIDDWKKQIREKKFKYEEKVKESIAQRDARTALNEYAPGQMVVIGEKNYTSAGIQFYGSFDLQTPLNYIYYCNKCGHIHYGPDRSENSNCSCGEPYRSVLNPNGREQFVRSYEPLGYRTFAYSQEDRKDATRKRYYEIRTELLNLNWTNPKSCGLCDVVESTEGDILYYNAGTGKGFAICKKCGRSVVEKDFGDNPPIQLQDGHLKLSKSENCEAMVDGGDIARNVILSAHHQTTLVALRLWEDARKTRYIKKDSKDESQESTMLSVGVILKKALVAYLGIDEGEIDFGIKTDKKSSILYIFDTNKGGCGYSNVLYDLVHCKNVFDLALKLLKNSKCDCETGELGACAHCLVSRTTSRFDSKLSKKRALDWLEMNNLLNHPIPTSVSIKYPEAKLCPWNVAELIRSIVDNKNVTDITLFAKSKDIDLSSWTSEFGEVGSLLNQARFNGKKTHIRVQYSKSPDSSVEELFLMAKIKASFPNDDIRAVESVGDMPMVMAVKDNVGTTLYFVEMDGDALNMNSLWGNFDDYILYSTPIEQINVNGTGFPDISDVQKLMQGNEELFWEGQLDARSFRLGNLFNDAILPKIQSDKSKIEQEMSKRLRGKNVEISYSDFYVNSALACDILVYFIDELRQYFGFSIKEINLSLDSNCCKNERWSEYEYVSKSFPSQEERNSYLSDLMEEKFGDVSYSINEDAATHHRWLRLRVKGECIVEIRPDHGIDGGWFCPKRYGQLMELCSSTKILRNEKKDTGVLYYFIIKDE